MLYYVLHQLSLNIQKKGITDIFNILGKRKSTVEVMVVVEVNLYVILLTQTCKGREGINPMDIIYKCLKEKLPCISNAIKI